MSGQPESGSRRHWGWHPLTDPWARRLVASAGISPTDVVLDIGAGTGSITRPLLRTGARVIAVEIHPARLGTLHALAEHRDNLVVVRADARDLRLPRRPFKVVSSPPYAGASAIIERLVSPGSRLVSADLVVQRQLARRFVDGRVPGARRVLSTYQVSVARRLPRTAFRPAPSVDSVVLRIQRR